ncbi:transmembrane protein [Ceratobasidium sp. AG-Ba]|nr:transmembrane protein [Ceratobasidium sp. AG-Ba]
MAESAKSTDVSTPSPLFDADAGLEGGPELQDLLAGSFRTTARGEEAAAAFIRDGPGKSSSARQAQAQAQGPERGPALPSLRDFVGETTPVASITPSPGPSRAVTPSYATDASSRTRADSGLDSPPPVWTPEQEELLRRIMGGPSGTSPPDLGTADPIAAMMSMFSGPGGPLGEMLGGRGGDAGIPPALKILGWVGR